LVSESSHPSWRTTEISLFYFLIKSKENQEQNKGFLVCFVSKWDTDCVGWSKAYLQRAHHLFDKTQTKKKWRKTKQREAKTGSAVEWDIYIFILFSAQIQECKIYDEEIWKLSRKKTIKQNSKGIYKTIGSR
jgi:hypothetical protein